MRKLKCFIACAFGRSDIDNLYNSAIKKVLLELNIIPLRVDCKSSAKVELNKT